MFCSLKCYVDEELQISYGDILFQCLSKAAPQRSAEYEMKSNLKASLQRREDTR
jgi:hypothetical protein